eukprot:scaffold324161_cov32-Prasinocladus_malaysianus.AAC.2
MATNDVGEADKTSFQQHAFEKAPSPPGQNFVGLAAGGSRIAGQHYSSEGMGRSRKQYSYRPFRVVAVADRILFSCMLASYAH